MYSKNPRFLFTGLAAIILLCVLSGCQDRIYEEYTLNVPVYMTYEELHAAVKSAPVQELKNPGKIYFKDNYIFINENLEGVHVFDNTDPSDPQKVTFIKIPGNVDIAIKDSILYADSYIDLVAIDISDLDDIREVARIEKVFTYTLPPWDDAYLLDQVDEKKGVVVAWEVRNVKKEIPSRTSYPMYPWIRFNEKIDYALANSSGVSGTGYGVGGSLARFILYEDILYAIHEWKLKLFTVSIPEELSASGTFEINWGLETVFINGSNLFIGTQTGMFIYDLSDPLFPEKISRYDHIRSCDPVVVEGERAYVTLRAGTICGGGENRLDVINIVNLYQPELIKSYEMVEPYGLGIDDAVLFICDGPDGLKIYDATDPYTIKSHLLAHYADLQPRDVIPLGEVLLTIGLDGFYQYDYSDLQNIRFLSKIPVTP